MLPALLAPLQVPVAISGLCCCFPTVQQVKSRHSKHINLCSIVQTPPLLLPLVAATPPTCDVDASPFLPPRPAPSAIRPSWFSASPESRAEARRGQELVNVKTLNDLEGHQHTSSPHTGSHVSALPSVAQELTLAFDLPSTPTTSEPLTQSNVTHSAECRNGIHSKAAPHTASLDTGSAWPSNSGS